ncbi:hypothetical protein [Ferrovum sp.]|uniref:hypothetical protein n=1 Tax=Ferrovum sp. TaxID=2609467 RepID=UPI002616E27E|nr:hypothetical protein [Ferrovum sp.]
MFTLIKNAGPNLFCSQCLSKQPPQGGGYIQYNGGRNRRFICAQCVEARQRKAQNKELVAA